MLGVKDYWGYYNCVIEGGGFKSYILKRKKRTVMMIDQIRLNPNESIKISTIETYVTLIPVGGTIKVYAGSGWDNLIGLLDNLEMISLPSGSGDYMIVASESNQENIVLLIVRYYLV